MALEVLANRRSAMQIQYNITRIEGESGLTRGEVDC
jgi:hypothetical protein